MVLVDKMILTGSFNEFVNEFIKIEGKDKEDQTLWQFWLHKVFDKTYQDFRASLKNEASSSDDVDKPSDEQLETTIKDSMEIINDFCLS